jgi:hypothetical protein
MSVDKLCVCVCVCVLGEEGMQHWLQLLTSVEL